MELSAGDLFVLEQCAISAAYQSGHIISSFIGSELSVATKNGGASKASQVVTEVDLLSQKCILDILQPTCDAFDLGLLTEECADDHSRLTKDYFWCIDPLDGTLPFIEGQAGYAVSIALVSRTRIPIVGMIYDPASATLYRAAKGQGAYVNSEPWACKAPHTPCSVPLTFVCDRSMLEHSQYDHILSSLEEISAGFGYSGVRVISQGGAAMNACWVLENAPACYFKLPKEKSGGGSLWDYAAAACIFNEIGAPASDVYGDVLDLNRRDSTFMNHRGVLFASDTNSAESVLALCRTLLS